MSTRFALIGMENLHASGWLNTFATLPEIRVVAAYRNRPEADLPVLRQLYGDVPTFEDVSEILEAADFEAALVLLNGREAPAAMTKLARAGKHILAEKPAARSPAELRPVLRAVHDKNLVFYPGFTTRARQVARDMRRAVQDGLLGDLLTVQASYFASLVERRGPEHELFQRDAFGGGILPWLGVHYLDLMRFVTAAEPETVAAIVENVSRQPIDVEDVAAIALRFDNHMLATFQSGYVMTREPKHLHFAVYGTRGWLRWQGGGDTLEIWSECDSWCHTPGRTLTYSAPQVPGYGGTDGQYFVRSFLRAMRGEEEPLLRVDDLYKTLQVIAGAYASSETGQYAAVHDA